jgi:hypothetical protein
MKKTEAGTTKAESVSGATDWSAQFATNWSEMLERSGQAYAKILTTWRDEMVGFTEKRVQADLDLMRDISGCRSWAEMVELQQSWLKQTVDHYVDENSRMMDLCREAAEEAETIKSVVESKQEAKPETRPETRQDAKHEMRRAA